MSNPRNRLACASCTRRKVKCSKTVPCTNCVRRGEQDSCSVETSGLVPTPAASLDNAGTASNASSPTSREIQELTYLRRRVAELEIELQDSGTHPPSLPLIPQHPSRPSQPHTPSLPPLPAHPPLHPANLESRHSIIKDDARSEGKPPASRDKVVEDAASILEFLAWGRRKNPDYQSVASPHQSLPRPSQVGDIQRSAVQPNGAAADHASSSFDDLTQISVLQLLLPEKRRVWDLVLWHEHNLLPYHCSYVSTALRRQLENFYQKHDGSIERPEVNLQWVAFLFSVLTGAITCAQAQAAELWGFTASERDTLSRRWFQAVISCLNKAEYTANHSILSVQAIATLTISAHALGFSNLQSIHLAAAAKIAQSLGLHRLTSDVQGSPEDKEAGRRVWAQLCCQDWWSIPFSETYLINPLYSKSDPPINCHDSDVSPLPDSTPTVSTFARFMINFATVMPHLQDGLMRCNTLYTKYEEVLKWDAWLNKHNSENQPLFLSNVPIDPNWPPFVGWARRAYAISSSHKFIMLHRSFLSESFINPAFAYTRKTCISKAKIIITEFQLVMGEPGPVLWIYQAFAVAASIILLLDIIHREPQEPDVPQHFHLVQTTTEILKTCTNSMIATRGVRLLSAMLEEIAGHTNGKKRRYDDENGEDPYGPGAQGRPRTFNVPAFVKSFCEDGSSSPSGRSVPSQVAPQPSMTHPQPTEQYFDPSVFENTSFEDLLMLANQDFFSF